MNTVETDNKREIDSVDTDKMIFVVGNSRSGTTLMGSVLGNAADIFTFEELHFFDQMLSNPDPQQSVSTSEAVKMAAQLFAIQASDFLTPEDPAQFEKEAQAVVEFSSSDRSSGDGAATISPAQVFKNFLKFTSHQSGRRIPCEQTPQNVFHIEELLSLYPDCRIINMVRDPRDVLLSQKYKWRIRFLGASNIPLFEAFRAWSNYHSAVIAKLWNAAVHSAERFSEHPRVKTVRFEDFIQNSESVLKDICEFAQIEFDPKMLDVSQGEGGVSSHKRISPGVRGIDSGVVSKWKKGGLLPSEIYLCQVISDRYMAHYSYAPVPISLVHRVASGFLLLLLPFKLSLALLLNLNRIGNMKETLKKRLQRGPS